MELRFASPLHLISICFCTAFYIQDAMQMLFFPSSSIQVHLRQTNPPYPNPHNHSPKKRVRLGSNLTCSFTPTAMFQSPTSTRVAAVSCCDDAALFARVPVPCVHVQPELRPTKPLTHSRTHCKFARFALQLAIAMAVVPAFLPE